MGVKVYLSDEGIHGAGNTEKILISQDGSHILVKYYDTAIPTNYLLLRNVSGTYERIAAIEFESKYDGILSNEIFNREKSLDFIFYHLQLNRETGMITNQTITICSLDLDEYSINTEEYRIDIPLTNIRKFYLQQTDEGELLCYFIASEHVLKINLIEQSDPISKYDTYQISYDHMVEGPYYLKDETIHSILHEITYRIETSDESLTDCKIYINEHERIYYILSEMDLFRGKLDKEGSLTKLELDLAPDYRMLSTLDILNHDEFVCAPVNDCPLLVYNTQTHNVETLYLNNYVPPFSISSHDGNVIIYSYVSYQGAKLVNLNTFQQNEFNFGISQEVLINIIGQYKANLANEIVLDLSYHLWPSLRISAVSIDELIVLLDDTRFKEYLVITKLSDQSTGIFSDGQALQPVLGFPVAVIDENYDQIVETFFDKENNLFIWVITENQELPLYRLYRFDHQDIMNQKLNFTCVNELNIEIPQDTFPFQLGFSTGFKTNLPLVDEIMETHHEAVHRTWETTTKKISLVISPKYFHQPLRPVTMEEDSLETQPASIVTTIKLLLREVKNYFNTEPSSLPVFENIKSQRTDSIILQIFPSVAYLEELYGYPKDLYLDLSRKDIIILDQHDLFKKLENLHNQGTRQVTLLNSAKIWYYCENPFNRLMELSKAGLEIRFVSNNGIVISLSERDILRNTFWNDAVESIALDKIVEIRQAIPKFRVSRSEEIFTKIADYLFFLIFSLPGSYQIEEAITKLNAVRPVILPKFSDTQLNRIIDEVFQCMKTKNPSHKFQSLFQQISTIRIPIDTEKQVPWEGYGAVWKDRQGWLRALKSWFATHGIS